MLHEKEKKKIAQIQYGRRSVREIIRRRDEKVISINHKIFCSPSLLVKWKIQIFHAYNRSYNLQSASNLFAISFLLNSHFPSRLLRWWMEWKLRLMGWSWERSYCEIEILFYFIWLEAIGNSRKQHHRMSLATFFCNLSWIAISSSSSSSWSFNGI